MKKIIPIFLYLSCFLYNGQAQKPASSLLWQITGNGLNTPSYLFGTFHLLCKSDFPIPDALQQKIAGTKQFYGELKMDDSTMQMQLMMKMVMTGHTLQSLIGEADFPEISNRFQQLTGVSLQVVNNFKPFMGLSLLVMGSIDCADKIQPESEFVKLAKEHQLPIYGLETIDDQLNAVDQEPLDSQIATFKKTVLNYDSIKTEMVKMIAVYKTRNVDSLYRFMKESGAGGNFEQAMLINRNKNWVPVMEKAMNNKSTFFAVGAGHLGGQEGILALLRQKGYKLTPVSY